MDLPVSECCRCCLATAVELQSMHAVCDANGADDTYMDRFHWCTSLGSFPSELEDTSSTINNGRCTTLPTAICSPCLQDLRVAYAFRQRCLHSDQILRDAGQLEPAVLKSETSTRTSVKEQTLVDDESGDWSSTMAGDDDIMVEDWIIDAVDETTDGQPAQQEAFYNDGGGVDDTVTVVEYADDAEHVDNSIEQEYVDDEQESQQQIVENSFAISFACQSCDEHFTNAALLLEHQSLCGTNVLIAHKVEEGVVKDVEIDAILEAGFGCDYCGKVLVTKAGLLKHMRMEHVETPSGDFLCTTCGKGFRTAQRLRVHSHTHTGERPHACDHCPMRFATEFRLRAHRRVHTGERPFHCSVCGQMFAQTNALKCHMRLHTGERPYVCRVCGKAFTQNTILKTHMALHTGKTVQCPDCDKKFARVSYLILHRREHTGEKPYACDRCPNRYRQQSHLSRHLDTHNGIRYPCEVCNKEYSKQWSLKMHMYTHSGERPFACALCDLSFVRRDKYRSHMRRKHAAESGDGGDGECGVDVTVEEHRAEEICGM